MLAKKILNLLVIFFSIFLAFGKFDPFGIGWIKDIVTVALILFIFFVTDVIQNIKYYKYQLFLLFSIGFFIFIGDLFYGYSRFYEEFFLLKYFSAIIVFWVLSYLFIKYKEICYTSLLTFSLTNSLIVLLYFFGYLNKYINIRSGRLYIFEENPNSVSTRISIAFIILLYFIVENPKRKGKIRLLLMIPFPFLLLFIVDTGSRSSFLAVIIGSFLILLLSKIKAKIPPAINKYKNKLCVSRISEYLFIISLV